VPSRRGRDRAPSPFLPEQFWSELARLSELGSPERCLHAEGFRAVCGVDEVGRGCLAGPVVAAAVILEPECILFRLNDSKKLGDLDRRSLCGRIMASARAVSVGVVEPQTIDRINILAASKLAMRQAVDSLEFRPDVMLIDAVYIEDLILPQIPIVQGDARCMSIAAASVVAKVYRDTLMESYHGCYPEYDFANNAGYGTAHHWEALDRFGPTPIHRRGFRGVVQKPLFG
jgi:ribonuclease HII